MSDERVDAIALANKLLDEPWCDPDDDLRVLARQLLRAHEQIALLEKAQRPTPADMAAQVVI